MPLQIKKYIPVSFKKVPAYVFKSPQRKLGFFKTIWLETSAITSLFIHQLLFSKKKLKPVSICTGIKNRNQNYLKYVLPSILKMDRQDLIEISIYDCGSDDFQEFVHEIKSKWKGKLVIYTENLPFTRSFSFNKAIGQATNDLFFATDADMTLPVNLVEICNRYVSKKTVWFPVCFFLFQDKPSVFSKQNGAWRPLSKGMFASFKNQFDKAGKFDLKYKTWGWEDIDLWMHYFMADILPVRTRCKGLIHNWHPSLEKEIPVPEHLKVLGFKS